MTGSSNLTFNVCSPAVSSSLLWWCRALLTGTLAAAATQDKNDMGNLQMDADNKAVSMCCWSWVMPTMAERNQTVVRI